MLVGGEGVAFGFAVAAWVEVGGSADFFEHDDAPGGCGDGLGVACTEQADGVSCGGEFVVGLGAFDGQHEAAWADQGDKQFDEHVQRADGAGEGGGVLLAVAGFVLAEFFGAVAEDGDVGEIEFGGGLAEELGLFACGF